MRVIYSNDPDGLLKELKQQKDTNNTEMFRVLLFNHIILALKNDACLSSHKQRIAESLGEANIMFGDSYEGMDVLKIAHGVANGIVIQYKMWSIDDGELITPAIDMLVGYLRELVVHIYDPTDDPSTTIR